MQATICNGSDNLLPIVHSPPKSVAQSPEASSLMESICNTELFKGTMKPLLQLYDLRISLTLHEIVLILRSYIVNAYFRGVGSIYEFIQKLTSFEIMCQYLEIVEKIFLYIREHRYKEICNGNEIVDSTIVRFQFESAYYITRTLCGYRTSWELSSFLFNKLDFATLLNKLNELIFQSVILQLRFGVNYKSTICKGRSENRSDCDKILRFISYKATMGKYPLTLLNRADLIHYFNNNTTKSILSDSTTKSCPACNKKDVSKDFDFAILDCCNHIFCLGCAERMFYSEKKEHR